MSPILMQQLYLKRGDAIGGPYPSTQFRQLWENGHVTADTLFRMGEDGEWKSVQPLLTGIQMAEKAATSVDIQSTIPPVLDNSAVEKQMLYVKTGDLIKGPYITKQFEKMWDTGIITADAKVRFGEDGDWQPVLMLVEKTLKPAGSKPEAPQATVARSRPAPKAANAPRKTSIASVLVLSGLLIAMVSVFFTTTGPWTESGKAKIEFKNNTLSAKSHLEESYENFGYLIAGAVKTAEAYPQYTSLIRQLSQGEHASNYESGFGQRALSSANDAYAEIIHADNALAILRKNRDVSTENVAAYDAFKNCVVTNYNLLSSLKKGTASDGNLATWIDARKQYKEQRLDLKLEAEFKF